jgi:hypothetical protein
MSVDYLAIKKKFVEIAQSAVGSRLSSTGSPTAPEASVIILRPQGPYPDYPYVTVDILDTVDEQGWLTAIEVDINDNPVYVTYEKMLISLRCYGGDAISIVNDLKKYFIPGVVRDDIRSTLGGSIVEILDIDSMPIKLSDKYLESAALNIVFNIVDSYTDTSTGIIDNVDLDGEVFRDDEDIDPYTTNIIAP